MNVVSEKEFSQDLGGATIMAQHGPVIVTNRGRATHVFMSFEDYEKVSRASAEAFLEAMVCEGDLEAVRLEFKAHEF